jgi:hypothetical protein
LQIYRFCGIVAIKKRIMYKKKYKNSSKALILCLLIYSCSTKTIQEELDDWCNCEKKANEDVSILDSCNQIMIDISLKYEFDPEAVPVIQQKVKKCK